MKRALLALVVVVLAGAGCRVRTELAVDVLEDGSGTVAVSVALDADAVTAYPSLATDVRLDDLAEAGWTVSGPTEEADGLTWLRATKPFATPAEATEVLAEVAGTDGPFQGLAVTSERSFARTRFGFTGTVDFDAGLEDFTDDDLADALEGAPLGEPVEAIEARIGERLDEVFGVRVVVRLPGSVESNAPTDLVNGAAWEPPLSGDEPVTLRATGEVIRVPTLVAAGAAVVAAVAALVILATVVLRRRVKPRGRHASLT